MYLIFDIGGSSTKIALVDDTGTIVKKASEKAKSSLREFIDMLDEKVEAAILNYDIHGIGISSPGTVDAITGKVGGISALEYIHQYNFAMYLQDKYKVTVAIENDANCAALCEIYFSKITEKNLAFFIIGSGIGGALVKDGKLLHGKSLEAGEFGYMLFKDGDNLTNLSRLATLPNVKRIIAEKYNINSNTYEILDMYFKKKEPFYKEVSKMYEYLSMGIYNVHYIFNPDLIYIGGAISQDERFVVELKNRMKSGIFAKANIEIRPVTYFNDNNLLGAYVNLINSLEEGRMLCIQ